MFWILVVGITMAVASAVFWVLEFKPFVDAVKDLNRPSSRNPIKCVAECAKYITEFIGALFLLWRLVLDILCTVWLAGAFGFSGMIGGIIGVSISNVISVYLWFLRPKNGI